MWLFAFRTEPTTTHNTFKIRAGLDLFQLKDLLTVSSRAEEVFRMFSHKYFQPSHAYGFKLLGGEQSLNICRADFEATIFLGTDYRSNNFLAGGS